MRNPLITMREQSLPFLGFLIGLFSILIYVEHTVFGESIEVKTIVIPDVATDENIDNATEHFIVTSNNIDVSVSDSNTNELFIEGNKLEIEQRWQDAVIFYEDLMQTYPSSEGFYRLARSLFQMDELKAAQASLNKSFSLDSTHLSSHFLRGVIYTQLDDHKKALLSYQAVLKKNPYHYEALYNMGLSKLNLNDSAGAIDTFITASESAGGTRKAQALFNLGVAYRRHAKADHTNISPEHNEIIKKARKALTQAIRLKPNYLKARFLLAALQENTAKGQQAQEEIYQTILQLSPHQATAHYKLALLYKKQGNKKLTQRKLLDTLQYNPMHHRAKFKLAEHYLFKQQWAKAKPLLDQLLIETPEDHEVPFFRARISNVDKDYTTALHLYQTALKLKPTFYEAQFNLATTYKRLGKLELAIQAYYRAIEMNADYYSAWYNIGVIQLREKNHDAAERSFKQALAVHPNYAQAWYNLARLYSKTQRNELAIVAYQKAIAIKPSYLKANLNLAVLLAKQGQLAAAIEKYQTVVELDDKYTVAWLNKGIAHMKMEDYDNAEITLERALALQPDNGKVLLNLARVKVIKKNYKAAVEIYGQLVEMVPASERYRRNYSEALTAAGMVNEGIRELAKADQLAIK